MGFVQVKDQLIFRVDSSKEIGTGHVSRCLALAKRAMLFGVQSRFMMVNLPGNINRRIQQAGFPIDELQTLNDPAEHQAIVQNISGPKRFIIDHYTLDLEIETLLRSFGPVLVIDDLTHRTHDCDVLLDSNYRKKFESLGYQDLHLPSLKLFGTKYIPLGDEFVSARREMMYQPKLTPPQVVVFFGGTDPLQMNREFVEIFSEIYQHQRSQKKWILVATEKTQLSPQLILSSGLQMLVEPSVASLLRESSFYLGSGGTITWERSCLGVVGAVVSIAANQEQISAELDENGYHRYFGPCDGQAIRKAIAWIEQLQPNHPEFVDMQQKSFTLVDGMGCERVLQLLLKHTLR